MSTELRFEISELVAQYVLHPDFRDFFVEGPRDKNFYDRFLKQVTIQNEPNCIKIQDVNIPFAAGLASSACIFASIAKALNALFSWELTTEALSILARRE